MGAIQRSFLVSSPLPNGRHEVHMLGGSHKILREEQGSAPKSEVTGLLMASRAQVQYLKILSDLNITRCIIASDSEVALNLTAGFSNALLAWFGPRIAEIQTNLRLADSNLYFIPGSQNPGDISSKSISLEILKSPHYWKTNFLEHAEKDWPMSPYQPKTVDNEMLKKGFRIVGKNSQIEGNSEPFQQILGYSHSFRKVKNVLGAVLFFKFGSQA